MTLACLGAYILWARRSENSRRRWGTVAMVIAIMYALEVIVVGNHAK